MTLPRKQLVAVEDTAYHPLFPAVYVAVTCVVLMLIPVKTMSTADGGLRTYPYLSSLLAIEICS
jgi:hypothetical protein